MKYITVKLTEDQYQMIEFVLSEYIRYSEDEQIFQAKENIEFAKRVQTKLAKAKNE